MFAFVLHDDRYDAVVDSKRQEEVDNGAHPVQIDTQSEKGPQDRNRKTSFATFRFITEHLNYDRERFSA